MTDPATLDEYNQRCLDNQRVEGFGMATTSVLPCPCCGAADWLYWNIAESAMTDYANVSGPHVCGACGRTSKMVIDQTPTSVTGYFALVAGSDLPAFMDEVKIVRDERSK